MRLLFLAGACACTFSTLAFGQTERDLDSHEHGAAIVSMALEPGVVDIQLESPWMNLVAFEYTPTSEADIQTLNEALALLARPDALFDFDAEGCVGQVVSIDSGMQGFEAPGSHDEHMVDQDHAAEHDKEHGHDDRAAEHNEEHEHDDHQTDTASHDEHGDEHDHHTHSELTASYRFECEGDALPTSMTARLMQQWPGIEALQVEFVGPGGQSAVKLGSGDTRISLDPVL